LQELQEKYDLDIRFKKNDKPALRLNAKGKIIEFLKIDQISVSSMKRMKALPKAEYRISKV